MSSRFVSLGLSRPITRAAWVGFAMASLLIAFLFYRPPEPAGGETNQSYRMLLDLSFRPAASAGLPVHTLDGPLAPLQHPVYVGRSIWRAITWQIAGNLMMAAIVTAGALQLGGVRRWWALTLFAGLGISHPSVAPWLAILVLGCWTTRNAAVGTRLLCGVGLGILALSSFAHFLLSVGIIAFSLARRNPADLRPLQVGAAPIGFASGLLGTWLLLEQPLPKLGRWVWFGLTEVWTPSALVLTPATAASFTWATLVAAAWIVIFVLCCRKEHDRLHSRVEYGFITWGGVIAWKFIALQPAGTPLLFFVTALCAGCLLLPSAPLGASVLLCLGVIGAAAPDKIMVTDAAGRLNRRLLKNIDEFRQLPGLRERLRRDFTGYGSSFTMPRTRGVLAGETVGIVGDSMPAILNEFRVSPSPSFGTRFVQDDRASRRNAEGIADLNAAPFWLQHIDDDSELLPGLRDGPAQLALYRGYDFVLREQGLSLWKKKPGSSASYAPPKLVKEGTLHFGETLSLPREGDDGFWLELDCSPNLAGLIRDQFKPLAEPALKIADREGNELRYALAWRMARAGFLARPFFRSDSDLLQFEEGNGAPQLSAVTVELPPETNWAWRSAIRYRIYQFPAVTPARLPGLVAPLKKQYAALNRLPASVSTPFAPLFGIVADQPAVFMHPNSALELIVTASDRVVRGSHGIAPGAYASNGPNVTDGVSFSIEFVPASGARTILFQRYLDPATMLEDRGPQTFSVTLPPSSGGRLLLRTLNFPGKTSSFDWSYWRDVEVK